MLAILGRIADDCFWSLVGQWCSGSVKTAFWVKSSVIERLEACLVRFVALGEQEIEGNRRWD